jgi:hypothetical protein
LALWAAGVAVFNRQYHICCATAVVIKRLLALHVFLLVSIFQHGGQLLGHVACEKQLLLDLLPAAM